MFRFALVPGFEGSHKCSVDGSTFASCNSGTTEDGFLVSDLSEGDHELRVFFDVQGSADDGPIETISWTVDRTGPADVRIDSGPPASTSETTAEFRFSSGASDLQGFRCSVDGGPGFLCGTPHVERDLAPGPHTFAVTAIDDVGNESAPADARWEVTGPAAPPPTGGESAGAGAELRLLGAERPAHRVRRGRRGRARGVPDGDA